MGHPFVTNVDFVAQLCNNASSDRAVIWGGEWDRSGIGVLDGGPYHKGKGFFGSTFSRLSCPLV